MKGVEMNSRWSIGLASARLLLNAISLLGLGAVCWLLAAVPIVAQAAVDPYEGVAVVEVFANSAMAVAKPANPRFELRIYRLDGIARAEEMANQGLPQTEVEALAFMARRQNIIRKQVEPLVLETVQGLHLAMQYRLDRIPAIVINQSTVVLGVADVDDALRRYQQHQRTKTAGGSVR